MSGGRGGVVLETERLRLRPFRLSEADRLCALINDWDVVKWLNHRIPFPYGRADAEAWIAHVRGQHATPLPHTFALALKDGDALIGCIGLDEVRGRLAQIGYWMGKPFWGHGFATEAALAMSGFAFAALDLACLHAGVARANHRSARALAKAGFSPIGEGPFALATHEGDHDGFWFEKWRDDEAG
jgi:RimJ/RimL family protein N-acetyltransferase